jgi:hypothetical protein
MTVAFRSRTPCYRFPCIRHKEANMQQRFKGQAGMGGRGKNQRRTRQDKVTPKRKRKTGGGASLKRSSPHPRGNQKRNQKQWSAKKRMQSRY